MQAPKQIKLHKKTQQLELVFADSTYSLSAEFLRVHSPSAEVKGHGPGQEVLQLNKENVTITNVLAQGNYAIKIVFSDGHDSGIYTWSYLYELGENEQTLWAEYKQKCEEHKEAEITSTVKWMSPK